MGKLEKFKAWLLNNVFSKKKLKAEAIAKGIEKYGSVLLHTPKKQQTLLAEMPDIVFCTPTCQRLPSIVNAYRSLNLEELQIVWHYHGLGEASQEIRCTNCQEGARPISNTNSTNRIYCRKTHCRKRA